MSEQGKITYHYAPIGDYTSSLMSFSGELENIKAQAQHELAALEGYYSTEQGTAAYKAAQTEINDGIEEGKNVIRAHGDAVDTAAQGMHAADAAAANRF